MDFLFLYPPAAKSTEPPIGVASLIAFLRRSGQQVSAIDANLGAYLFFLDAERLTASAGSSPPVSLRRAISHVPRALQLLRSDKALQNFARYCSAVHDLNRALSVLGADSGEQLTLGDYRHPTLSPFSPTDLESLARGEQSTLFRSYFETELLPQLAQDVPKRFAISINYLHQILPGFELAGLLRRCFPETPIMAGGGVFTSWQPLLEQLDLRFSCFDHVVFGPGEEPLRRLADGAGEETDYFLSDRTTLEYLPEFDDFALADYFSPLPVLPLSSSRGCYWGKCRFCPESEDPLLAFHCRNHGWREVMLELAEKHGARHFHFTDNAIPPAVLRDLARDTRGMDGLHWYGFVRFESLLLDQPLVDNLAASGCRMLQLGLESGSEQVLARLNKGVELAQVPTILTNLRRAGIATYVYLMLGTPGETEQDAGQTLAFVEQHAALIDYLNLSVMNLPRDSELLDANVDFGIAASALLGEDQPLGLYRSFAPRHGWDRAAARRFLSDRLQRSPAVQQILRRTPPQFTSNHAFFFRGTSF